MWHLRLESTECNRESAYIARALVIRCHITMTVGGGQLGRMMIEAANRLGVRVAVLDPGIFTRFLSG